MKIKHIGTGGGSFAPFKANRYVRFFHEADKGTFGGNAATMTQPEFQKAAADALTGVQDQTAAMLANYKQLDGKVQKALEDFTAEKNKNTDNFASLETSMKRLTLALAQ